MAYNYPTSNLNEDGTPKGFEDVVDCPYNKAHQILRHKLQVHLVKCRKSYPETNLIICPFNATHHVPEPEMKFHMSECPDKASLHKYKYTAETGREKVFGEKENELYDEPVESEENWDEINVDTYDPQKYATSANVLRNKAMIGLAPSQRKAFRKEEVLRLNNIQ